MNSNNVYGSRAGACVSDTGVLLCEVVCTYVAIIQWLQDNIQSRRYSDPATYPSARYVTQLCQGIISTDDRKRWNGGSGEGDYIHLPRCRSLPCMPFSLYSRSSFVRSGPVIWFQPARGTMTAVMLSSLPISSAKVRIRSAATFGVSAPRARSETSSSDTTEDTPSERRVR